MMKQLFLGLAAVALIAGPLSAQQQKKPVAEKEESAPANGKPCCNMPAKRPVAKAVKPAATKDSVKKI